MSDIWMPAGELINRVLNEYAPKELVEVKEKGDLRLFDYSRKTQLEGHWDEVTKVCRGIIVDIRNEEYVALPFPKFFNLGEHSEDQIPPLHEEKATGLFARATVTEKMDGSLGIVYHYDGEWHASTRGSFESDQAKWATQFIRENWKFNPYHEEYTFLAEIIYPENRIVVDYGSKRDMILLGMINRDLKDEVSPSAAAREAKVLGAPFVNVHQFTDIDDILEEAKAKDHNSEGWVIHWPDRHDFRIKVKTPEYVRMHKLVSTLSPLSIWRKMVNGKVPEKELEEYPDEFDDEINEIVEHLEKEYEYVRLTAHEKWLSIQAECTLKDPQTRDDFKILAAEINKIKGEPSAKFLRKACFLQMRGHEEAFDELIKEQIRPHANNLGGIKADTLA